MNNEGEVTLRRLEITYYVPVVHDNEFSPGDV
jgi:hypothetical protein